jgi:hypothetical protein
MSYEILSRADGSPDDSVTTSNGAFCTRSGKRELAATCCFFPEQGSGTKAIQRPFALCVALFLCGYLTIVGLGWSGGSWRGSAGMLTWTFSYSSEPISSSKFPFSLVVLHGLIFIASLKERM